MIKNSENELNSSRKKEKKRNARKIGKRTKNPFFIGSETGGNSLKEEIKVISF